VPKTVALLALRKNLAVRPDLNKREIFEKELSIVPSSDPTRLVTSPVKITAVDPIEGVKRPWQASHGLLLQYPLKDQRSRTLVRSSRKNAEESC
jgi:hypothetical protein